MAEEDEQMDVQGEEEVNFLSGTATCNSQYLLRQPLTCITNPKPIEQVEEVEEAPAAEMSVVDSLKEVLKKALIFDGLRRGLHE